MADKLCVIAGVGSGMGQAIARAFAETYYVLFSHTEVVSILCGPL